MTLNETETAVMPVGIGIYTTKPMFLEPGSYTKMNSTKHVHGKRK